MSAAATTESKTRTILLAYFPMFIATLSLCTSIFNGYLNLKFVDFIQRNTGRTEYLRTCKEIIDAYFQVKVRAGMINAKSANDDGAATVARFAALGTYLANLRDDATRRQYTELSDEVANIVKNAASMPSGDFQKAFDKADA